MNGKTYKAIRESLNEEKYEVDKRLILKRVNEFQATDNLTSLMEMVLLSIDVLEKNGFPIKKFNKYKYEREKGDERRKVTKCNFQENSEEI